MGMISSQMIKVQWLLENHPDAAIVRYVQLSLECDNINRRNSVQEKENEVPVKLESSLKNKTRTPSKRQIQTCETWYMWCEKHGATRKLKDVQTVYWATLFQPARRIVHSTNQISCNFTTALTATSQKITRRTAWFAPSREKLKASQKFLKGEGKGKKPNASEPLDRTEMEQLCEVLWEQVTRQLSSRQYCGLLVPIWEQGDMMSIISSALVTCCWRTGGAEFIEFACEHGTKTRMGKMEKSTNADSHVFKPKMRATAERCVLWRSFSSW